VTITKGGPTDDIDDGVYPVILTAISDPKTVTATRGPNAGKDVDLIDWGFAVDEGDAEGYEITATTSTASGPKSKMFAFLTALFGGKAPPVGTQLQKDQIIGRRALATIAHNDGGWPVIANLGAIPNTMPLPQAQRQPVMPTNTEAMVPQQRRSRQTAADAPRFNAQGQIPVATAPAAADDDLPF
jgi:hypothetical protein